MPEGYQVSGINYDKEYVRRLWCLDEEIKLKRSMGRGQLKVSLLNEDMYLNGVMIWQHVLDRRCIHGSVMRSRSYIEFNRMVMNCTRCGRRCDRFVS
jgi:hypothetical protein